MPVLHKYKNRNEYYILTMIGKTVATFHLKNEGYRKLAAVGIKKGDTFPRALLLDLYRVGDAYTHKPMPGDTDAKPHKLQLKFDFPDDPEPEGLFPCCSACSSVADLHVVEIKQPEHIAAILCSSCREKKAVDSSIPLPLVTGAILAGLLKIKKIHKVHTSVLSYQKLLDAEFESKWDHVLKNKPQQSKLFDTGDSRQTKPARKSKKWGCGVCCEEND
jgi:hypothetical protein